MRKSATLTAVCAAAVMLAMFAGCTGGDTGASPKPSMTPVPTVTPAPTPDTRPGDVTGTNENGTVQDGNGMIGDGDIAGDIGGGMNDVIDGVQEGANDIIDGVENGIGDMTGSGTGNGTSNSGADNGAVTDGSNARNRSGAVGR